MGNPHWTLTERPTGKLTMTRWPLRGDLKEARQCSQGPLGGDGSHERPVGKMARSHSQWWVHICRRMCSRRTAHTAPYSFRSNLCTDPQAVPSHFILNLRCLLLKTWKCVPTETRHAGTFCPAPDICETAERKEEGLHRALQFLQAAGARQNMPTC